MRFSFAVAVAALAAGAVATGADAEEEYTTIMVTEYETYCPSATTLTHGTETIPVPSAGTVTLSNGPYTITRPLITSTITRCKACTSATPSPSTISVSVPVIPVPSSSAPVIPTTPVVTPPAPTGVEPSGTTPSTPVFTGAAGRAAVGAGAGLATVFGLMAALL